MTPRLDILPAAQRRLWPRLDLVPHDFVLYGGTGLALRLAHRHSVDFDFFSASPLYVSDLLRRLDALSPVILRQELETLEVRTAEGVLLSFFGGLTLGQVDPPDDAGPIVIASAKDLFATKLAAVYQRSETKDYIDVAALIESGRSLAEGLGCAAAVHGERFNTALPLKALAYFEDVEPPVPLPVRDRLVKAVSEVRTIPKIPLTNPVITRSGDAADAASKEKT